MGDQSLPAKPRPRATPVSEPFWEGLQAGVLRLQRCGDCRTWVHYPRLRCTACLSDNLTWEEVEASGTLYAATIARQATAAPFADEVPQVIAVVELSQGTRITTTLTDAGDSLPPVGAPVEGVIDRGPDGIALLRFRLRPDGAAGSAPNHLSTVS